MSRDALPVAVIGVGGFGASTLRALLQSDRVKVVGVADKVSRVAEQTGEEFGVPHYTDNRSLLVETRPKAVFLAVPPAAAAELVVACAERRIHVWKELPLARTLAEGVALVRRSQQAKIKFAVGTQRRFACGYRRAMILREKLGDIFLARSHYLFNWGPNLGWRGDKASAGGGALLELGYHLVDLLNWMLGFPQEVYGFNAGGNQPQIRSKDGKPLPIYDTDDTAAGLLRFEQGVMSTMVASRSSGPVSEELTLHGRGGSIRATGESFLLRDADGNVLDSFESGPAPLDVLQRQVEAFAEAVAEDLPRYECSAMENLLNLAVIEAMYLSNQTGAPEIPEKLLKAHGLTPRECLELSPPGGLVEPRCPGGA